MSWEKILGVQGIINFQAYPSRRVHYSLCRAFRYLRYAYIEAKTRPDVKLFWIINIMYQMILMFATYNERVYKAIRELTEEKKKTLHREVLPLPEEVVENSKIIAVVEEICSDT